MCDTSVGSSRSLGLHMKNLHDDVSEIDTWNWYFLCCLPWGNMSTEHQTSLWDMTRPSPHGNAVGLKGFHHGWRIPREAASSRCLSNPRTPSAAPNTIGCSEKIPLSAHSVLCGSTWHTAVQTKELILRFGRSNQSKIIVISMCVARAREVSTDAAPSGEGFSHQRIGPSWTPRSTRNFMIWGVR